MTTLPAEPRVARYTVGLASTAVEMREAQRLRHQVFAEEMGARLDSPITGLDVDPLDAYCDHLLVRHGDTGEVVGTYRLLTPRRADRLYSDSEFDLSALAGIRPGMVEAGRACVHADHRGGAVLGLMWAGIARYMVAGGTSGWPGAARSRCPPPPGSCSECRSLRRSIASPPTVPCRSTRAPTGPCCLP